jgi:hypothetical protein
MSCGTSKQWAGARGGGARGSGRGTGTPVQSNLISYDYSFIPKVCSLFVYCYHLVNVMALDLAKSNYSGCFNSEKISMIVIKKQ